MRGFGRRSPVKTWVIKWSWLAAVLVVLTIFTTPEIGGLYFGWIWLLTLGAVVWRQQKFSRAADRVHGGGPGHHRGRDQIWPA